MPVNIDNMVHVHGLREAVSTLRAETMLSLGRIATRVGIPRRTLEHWLYEAEEKTISINGEPLPVLRMHERGVSRLESVYRQELGVESKMVIKKC